MGEKGKAIRTMLTTLDLAGVHSTCSSSSRSRLFPPMLPRPLVWSLCILLKLHGCSSSLSQLEGPRSSRYLGPLALTILLPPCLHVAWASAIGLHQLGLVEKDRFLLMFFRIGTGKMFFLETMNCSHRRTGGKGFNCTMSACGLFFKGYYPPPWTIKILKSTALSKKIKV